MEVQFHSLSEFLHMGGHGVFVLSVYGIVIATLVILALKARWRFQSLREDVHRRLRLEAIEHAQADGTESVTVSHPGDSDPNPEEVRSKVDQSIS